MEKARQDLETNITSSDKYIYDPTRSIHESKVNISHEASVTSYVYEIRPKIKGPFDGC